jgi:phage terminase small subunit
MANHPHNSDRPEPRAVMEALAADDMEKLYEALTVRQKRFCEEYSIDFDGKAAAIRAGYASKWADRQAYILLKHRGVARYIDHLTQSREAKIVSVNPDYVIQQVTAIIGKPGAKDSDRLRGLELLARHLGMFIDRQELTGKNGGPLEIEQKAKEDAQSFTHLLRQLRDRAEKDKKEKTSEPIRNS